MATNTPSTFRNLIIYEVYVRNHGPNGTFDDVRADLPRIRAMGVDVVWFMPIHPIGQVMRKGTLGSPYSITDYRAVNPEYGTLESFGAVIEEAHTLGLRVMIDVVYNHTAHDSILAAQHLEWFHRDGQGRPVTTVPEWSDVIDLLYDDPDLWSYLIDTLKYWVRFGIDGFRCDVASLIPLEFWQTARQEVNDVNPNLIWLAESVHARFVRARRHQGLVAHADSELYSAFDITYIHDIYPVWEEAVANPDRIHAYLEMLRFQDGIYPANYIKLRFVENHDRPRIMARVGHLQALAWTAFEAFNRGAFLIYAGQEAAAKRTPSLFEVDKIQWGNYELQPFLGRLATLKKEPAQTEGKFSLLTGTPAIAAIWQGPQNGLYGIFNVADTDGHMETHLPDGPYEDALTGEIVKVQHGRVPVPPAASIVRYNGVIPDEPLTRFKF